MTDLLSPLKEKIATFEKKVEETYEKGLKDQTDLRAELKKLYELNSKISLEANNLTKALKGDVKQQGNWGELVLERILDRSGLTKGVEYEREVVTQNEEGARIRPDVIIKLPENKHLIVDSKVSLVAYEKAVNSEVEEQRLGYLKEHVNSIKQHIKGLAEKHYSSARNLNSPDFVLLFIPVESSFSLAVQQDNELFNIAWDNKIVIVSPSTLLATLRTVSSIWRQEQQTQNVQEIARQGGALYDKFVGFYTDLEKVGKKMQEAQTAYVDSMKKLYDGKDNLVRKAERLRDLGAKTQKELPQKLIERAEE
ncbi:MAG: recombinase RmuC [Bacteroidia bacterium]|nr:MAG: recombinase RmuC [Bacteroidia bacterium]